VILVPIELPAVSMCTNHFHFYVTDSIKKWWIWGYWISPLMYVQNAISVNEFMGHSWDKVNISEVLGYIIIHIDLISNLVGICPSGCFVKLQYMSRTQARQSN
jgi:hypothetical protein